jgi:hypothetical protein
VHLETGSGLRLRAHLASPVAASLERGAMVWADWAPDDAVALTE